MWSSSKTRESTIFPFSEDGEAGAINFAGAGAEVQRFLREPPDQTAKEIYIDFKSLSSLYELRI